MPTINILRNLIKDDATVEIKVKFNNYYCDLDELDSDYKLTINNLPQDTIVIKADKFPEPSKIFNGSKMECKRADFVVVTETPTKKIFYIELKRSKNSASSKEINAQLMGAKCLMEYCKAIGREFWKVDNFLEGYEPRYVKFVSQTLNKRPTRRARSSLNNTPETATIIKNSSRIQFNQLSYG